VGERNALALDDVDPRGGDVEQGIDEVIGQQIHLIDVQDAAIRGGQQTRLEAVSTVLQRGLQVEGAQQTVFRRAHRQLDHAHAAGGGRQRRTAGAPFPAGETTLLGALRIAGVRAVGHHRDLRQ
jgi:hypothetical protein